MVEALKCTNQNLKFQKFTIILSKNPGTGSFEHSFKEALPLENHLGKYLQYASINR